MKRFILILTALWLTACAKGGDDASNSGDLKTQANTLNGSWSYSEGQTFGRSSPVMLSSRITFRDDGTYSILSYAYYGNTSPTVTYQINEEGTYELNGEDLKMTYKYATCPHIYAPIMKLKTTDGYKSITIESSGPGGTTATTFYPPEMYPLIFGSNTSRESPCGHF